MNYSELIFYKISYENLKYFEPKDNRFYCKVNESVANTQQDVFLLDVIVLHKMGLNGYINKQ